MRIFLLTFALACAIGAAQPLVIRGAKVFDSEAGGFRDGWTVVIEGDRITGAGEGARSPRGAKVIDARGQFLIPGLIDAHVHLTHVLWQAGMTGDEVLPIYVKHGVTSVRSTGDNVVAQTLLKKWAEANPAQSPRIFVASPLIGDLPPIHPDVGWALTTPAQVPDFVALLKKWNVSTVKLYANIKPEVGRAVIAEAHKAGLFVTGHLASYPVEQAVDDGIDAVEHIESVADFLRADPRDRFSVDLDREPSQQLIRKIGERHLFVDPTLTVFFGALYQLDDQTVLDRPDNLAMPAPLREWWAQWNGMAYTRFRGYMSPPREVRLAQLAKYQRLTGMLHKAGARIAAGTDAPEPQVPPGSSLHWELELLAGSGMTPAEVLRAATYQNAQLLRQSDLGVIRAGARADLVLLTADPSADIKNTRRIKSVIVRGRLN